MVNILIVSEYSGGPPPGDRVKIGGGPLYDLPAVRALAAQGGAVRLWTTKCAQDVRNLLWDEADVAELLNGLEWGQYLDSEWCSNGRGAWAACDAYRVKRREWVPAARKEMDMEYFVKFAVGKTRALVLMVSCHV